MCSSKRQVESESGQSRSNLRNGGHDDLCKVIKSLRERLLDEQPSWSLASEWCSKAPGRVVSPEQVQEACHKVGASWVAHRQPQPQVAEGHKLTELVEEIAGKVGESIGRTDRVLGSIDQVLGRINKLLGKIEPLQDTQGQTLGQMTVDTNRLVQKLKSMLPPPSGEAATT
jgi:hypothetical protein